MTDPNNQKGILLEVGTNEVEFLLFRLGKQAYGINVAKVCQIIIFNESKVAPLPRQPTGVLGVMDLRGETITVVDIKNHFGLKSDLDLGEHVRLLLIVEFNKKKTAFVVDGVDRIERCNWKQFEAMKQSGSSTSNSSVVGTITLKDEIVIILDVETVMGDIDPTMSVEHYENQISKAETLDRSTVTIVSCEDSAVIQKVLLRTLDAAGFKNIKAYSNGEEGINFLENLPPGSVDIIVTDIEMPQMDGLTLCKMLRSMPKYSNTPIVFFSSMINEQMANKCKAVGGNSCFSKPEIHLLVDAIDKLVSEKRTNQ